MGRNYLTRRDGDRINAVVVAAGYNFSLLPRWFEELLRVLSLILCHALLAAPPHLTRCRPPPLSQAKTMVRTMDLHRVPLLAARRRDAATVKRGSRAR